MSTSRRVIRYERCPVTVYVVRLNATVAGVCASPAAAEALMAAIQAEPTYAGETWRKVGDRGWSSGRITALRYEPYDVEGA